jgi:site-specific DNA recombinase
MKRAVIYTRVSLKKESQASSLDNQREYYTSYCSKNNYDLVKIYADKGLSATSSNRKDFLEMLEDAGLDIIRGKTSKEITFEVSNRKPNTDYIITKDVSRFARNTNATDIVRKLRQKHVYIIFENTSIRTDEDDWEFKFGLFVLFSQQESIDRSHKVEFAYKQKAENKEFHMSVLLFGYDRDEESGDYVINEQEAKVVRLIYDLYINKNMGCSLIAKHLNEQGLKTKKGVNWRSTSVKRTINNEKYKGLVILRRKTKTDITGSAKVIKRDPNEWKQIEGVLPAIVDEDTWNKAEEIMQNRVVEMADGSLKGLRKSENVFYKKIICSKCLADFVMVSGTKIRFGKKVTELTYYCRNRRLFNTCDMRGISHNVLERELRKIANEGFNNYLTNHISDEKKAYKDLIESLDNKLETVESNRDEIKSEIESINTQINKLYSGFLQEDASEIIINLTTKKIEELGQTKNKLELKLLDFDINEIEKSKEFLKRKFKTIEKLSKKKTFTYEEILGIVANIAVYPDKRFRITLEIPSLMANVLVPEKYNLKEEINLRTSFEILY